MESVAVSPGPGLSFRVAVPDSPEPNAAALRRGHYPDSLRPLFMALQAVANPPARVLDLGGYLGAFGLAAAAAGYQVAIVEASAPNADSIRRSVAVNEFAHPVRVLEAVVGPSEGWTEFCGAGPYGHVLTNKSNDRSTGKVRQLTLSSLLEEIAWTAPDFIKMDIEGSEARVLRGAAPWFALGHRPTLLFEANGFTLDWFGDSPASLRALVEGLGYAQYEVDDRGQFRKPSRFEPRCVVDYLAIDRPVPGALPPRSLWRIFRRTASALRSSSPQAREYTWKALRTLLPVTALFTIM